MADFDLVALWDAHCRYEFETRDVDATMATMTREPYVNHIPTMTGGVGRAQLQHFYAHHFIGANPPDTRLVPISRTVGADRVVDEMLFCFAHTCEIDWMLPGLAPTGRSVEVPLVAIVQFQDGKVAHNTSIGIRPRFWSRSARSILAGCRSPAWRRLARWWTRLFRATVS